MKFRILSDLHTEFSRYEVPTRQGDLETVLILAGDIGMFKRKSAYADFLEDCSVKFKHVVVVPGNHEYYKTNIGRGSFHVRELIEGITNISILEKETVIVDDVAIIGATLWTDFGRDELVRFKAQEVMNDYRQIRYGPEAVPWQKKLHTNDTLAMHFEHKKFIFSEVQKHKNDGLKTVVISHHGPSTKSIDTDYIGDELNYAYISDQSEDIFDYAPNLWIHGHVHQNFDYEIGDTRVVCNPRGYPNRIGGGFENPNFDDFFSVEI
ncbi:3',5'-cyclic AMP phosphodiesterase protein [Vibrio phage 2.275.O._10N.286.54.E11]|nr:3',5'-cyclic AMP phosphodiesterase protein [Vibrio phage 2.275.O._10N.286.54.E11]